METLGYMIARKIDCIVGRIFYFLQKKKVDQQRVNYLNSFGVLKMRQEISLLHARYVVNLDQFSKTRIESCLNQAFKGNNVKYNEIVTKNR